MKRFFCKNKRPLVTKVDPKDLIEFYQMLLKMQKRRNNLNLDRMMKSIYGDNFRDFL